MLSLAAFLPPSVAFRGAIVAFDANEACWKGSKFLRITH
jgi:hypothetical protein